MPLTNVVLATGSLQLTDSAAAPGGARFYRALALGATALKVPTGLVWIGPGQFLMGSPATEQDRNSDEGPHAANQLRVVRRQQLYREQTGRRFVLCDRALLYNSVGRPETAEPMGFV